MSADGVQRTFEECSTAIEDRPTRESLIEPLPSPPPSPPDDGSVDVDAVSSEYVCDDGDVAASSYGGAPQQAAPMAHPGMSNPYMQVAALQIVLACDHRNRQCTPPLECENLCRPWQNPVLCLPLPPGRRRP